MSFEHQNGVPPRIDAVGFTNLLDKNTAQVQAAVLTNVFREAEQQAGTDNVAVFACELREDTVELLEANGYSGDFYLQHPTQRFGQMLLSNVGKPAIEAQHHVLTPWAWKGRRSGPAALTIATIDFGGEVQKIGGTHLTHLTGNILAQLFEAGQLSRLLRKEEVGMVVLDSNHGEILRHGLPLADASHNEYFSTRPVSNAIRKVTVIAEPHYNAHLWRRLHQAGYVQSETTRQAVTWVPDPAINEGTLDRLAARHSLEFTTDQLIGRDLGSVAVRVLSHMRHSTDHTPFVVTLGG